MLPGRVKHRFGWVDALILAAFALVLVYVETQISTVLNYHWKWAALSRFFLRYAEASGHWVSNLLLQGLVTTLRLSVWGGVVAVVAGVAVCICRPSPSLALRLLGGTYVELIRNVPPLVFVFIIYFFLSTQIMEATGLEPILRGLDPATLPLVEFLCGDVRQIASFVLALGLFTGAYVAEIIRGGINSVNRGQWEAAKSMGLNRLATLRLVVLPQALARIWGPLSNKLILLVKFSSLASLVSVQDLTFQAFQVGVTSRGMFEVWIVVAAMYFAVSTGLARLLAGLERRSGRYLVRSA